MAEALALLSWEENGLVGTQTKLANFVSQLQSMLDINAAGIPCSYIDPTVIAECVPYAESTDDIPEEKYNASIIPIEFEDGIPIVNGIPVWERLDGEPIAYYKIFKEYRDMKLNDPARSRSMGRMAENMDVPGKFLTILSKIYNWMFRVKAFDMNYENEIALKRHHMALDLETKHSKYANTLVENAMKYLEEHPAQLNPKIAMQMVEIGMKYGRISVGLQGDKPGSQSAAGHQTNIAISQQMTHTEADLAIIGQGDMQGQRGRSQMSQVERQLADNMKDVSVLSSVMHVLNKSGALGQAVRVDLAGEKPASNEDNEIEGAYKIETEAGDSK